MKNRQLVFTQLMLIVSNKYLTLAHSILNDCYGIATNFLVFFNLFINSSLLVVTFMRYCFNFL